MVKCESTAFVVFFFKKKRLHLSPDEFLQRRQGWERCRQWPCGMAWYIEPTVRFTIRAACNRSWPILCELFSLGQGHTNPAGQTFFFFFFLGECDRLVGQAMSTLGIRRSRVFAISKNSGVKWWLCLHNVPLKQMCAHNHQYLSTRSMKEKKVSFTWAYYRLHDIGTFFFFKKKKRKWFKFTCTVSDVPVCHD